MSTRVVVYEDGKKVEGKHSLSDAHAASRDHRGAVVWISLVEPSKEELDCVARLFGLQELTAEDTETRKGVVLKYQGRRLTLTVGPARYLDPGTVEIGELDVYLEEGLAITVSRGEDPEMHDVEQDLEESSELSRLGVGAILRALLDQVVDDYTRWSMDSRTWRPTPSKAPAR